MSESPFLRARELLLRHRDDPVAASREFAWPVLDRFNWALDYFDVFARANHRIALHVSDDGTSRTHTFAEMSDRSNRAANFLRRRGVRRGDRILIMLGNVPELWEVTLAAMKLGAVFSPATTLLTAGDLRDRIERGGIRHVIAAEGASKFDEVGGDFTRSVVGPARSGWKSYDTDDASEFKPDGETLADDPLVLYLPPARRQSRRSSCTRTGATRSATCPPCTGSVSVKATCTGTSARLAGPSTPGAASSRRGTRAPRSLRSTTSA
jgi:acetyl-CoA synthetase